jgi:hypothetical protein
MPEITEQQLDDYIQKEEQYLADFKAWRANYVQGGENPNKPLPTKPPGFNGWDGE